MAVLVEDRHSSLINWIEDRCSTRRSLERDRSKPSSAKVIGDHVSPSVMAGKLMPTKASWMTWLNPVNDTLYAESADH